MKCTSDDNGFFEDLGALLDGELGGPRRAEVERHLQSCEACREEFARLRKLSSLVGDLPSEKAPGGVLASVMSSVKSSVASAKPVEAEETPAPKLLSPRRWIGGVSAVAAALLVGVVVFSALEREDSRKRVEPFGEEASRAIPEVALADEEREEAVDAPSADGHVFKRQAAEPALLDAVAPVEAAKEAKFFGATNDASPAPARPAAGLAARAVANSAPADSVALDSSRAKASIALVAPAPARNAPEPLAPMPKGAARSGRSREDASRRASGAKRDLAKKAAAGPGIPRPEERPANEIADKPRDKPHDERLVGERLAFEGRDFKKGADASRKREALLDGGAAPDAEGAALALGMDDEAGADRDALELARELRALLADGEARQEAKAPGARRDTDAGGEAGKPTIRIRTRGDNPALNHIHEILRRMGGSVESASFRGGARGGLTGYQVRVPADRVLAFVEQLQSGKTPQAKGRTARAERAEGAGASAGARVAVAKKKVEPARDDAATGLAGGAMTATPKETAVDWVTVEVIVMLGSWNRPAAARAKIDAAEADAAKAGAAGETGADTPAKDAAPSGRR